MIRKFFVWIGRICWLLFPIFIILAFISEPDERGWNRGRQWAGGMAIVTFGIAMLILLTTPSQKES